MPLVRSLFQAFFCALLSIVLLPATSRAQQSTPSPAACPGDHPGVYVRGAGEWHLLSQASPSKVKAKHAYLSSLSYGAVSAPMVAEYPGPHAAVEIHATRPIVCVSHLLTSNPPMLVRLNEKKKTRELDSGTIRAVPLVGSAKQAEAQAGSVVLTTADQPESGVTLLRPQADMAPGEYAVMFGAQNLAILDFGIAAGQ